MPRLSRWAEWWNDRSTAKLTWLRALSRTSPPRSHPTRCIVAGHVMPGYQAGSTDCRDGFYHSARCALSFELEEARNAAGGCASHDPDIGDRLASIAWTPLHRQWRSSTARKRFGNARHVQWLQPVAIPAPGMLLGPPRHVLSYAYPVGEEAPNAGRACCEHLTHIRFGGLAPHLLSTPRRYHSSPFTRIDTCPSVEMPSTSSTTRPQPHSRPTASEPCGECER
jgi:hypothetical protein